MTWERGDLALCIKIGAWRGNVTGLVCTYETPKPGVIYTVACVHLTPAGPGLTLTEIVNQRGLPWDARRFVRITDLTTDERNAFLADLDHDLEVAYLQKVYRS
jgi:hypothetical protein